MTRIEEGVSIELIEETLKNGEDMEGMKKPVNIESITKVVCQYFNVHQSLIPKKTRKREIKQARQIIMYFSKKYIDTSFRVIGENLGGFDHATVIHARKIVNNLCDTEKSFKNDVTMIDSFLKMYYEIHTPFTHTN